MPNLDTYKALIDWGDHAALPDAGRLQPRVPRAEPG